MNGLSVILAVLATAPVAGEAPTAQTISAELRPATGMLVSGYQYRGGAVLTPWAVAGTDGRMRWALGHGTASLLLDAGALGLVPLGAPGPSAGLAAVLRLGVEMGAWSVTVGAYGRVDATPAPAQLLPSAQVSWRRGDLGLSLGLLDRPLGPVARLTLEYGAFGIGYAGLAGLEGWVRLPVGDAVDVEVRAFGSRVFSSLQAGGVVGLVWRLDGAAHGGGR